MKEEKKSRSCFVGLNNNGLLAIDYILAIKLSNVLMRV